MYRDDETRLLILIVEDVAETRDGIEQLLTTDGYRVTLARDERDAIESARRRRPDLILVSLAGLPSEVIATARRIREQASVGNLVPVVIFCLESIDQGAELEIGENVHISRPDNFNQLRRLLKHLLDVVPLAA